MKYASVMLSGVCCNTLSLRLLLLHAVENGKVFHSSGVLHGAAHHAKQCSLLHALQQLRMA